MAHGRGRFFRNEECVRQSEQEQRERGKEQKADDEDAETESKAGAATAAAAAAASEVPSWFAHFPIATTEVAAYDLRRALLPSHFWSDGGWWVPPLLLPLPRPRFLHDFSAADEGSFAAALTASSFVPGLMGLRRPWLPVHGRADGAVVAPSATAIETAEATAETAVEATIIERKKKTKKQKQKPWWLFDGYMGALRARYPTNYCFVAFLRASLPAAALPASPKAEQEQSGGAAGSLVWWWERKLTLWVASHRRLLNAYEYDTTPTPGYALLFGDDGVGKERRFFGAAAAVADVADTLLMAWPRGDVEWADDAFDRGRGDAARHLPELRRRVRHFLEGVDFDFAAPP